MRDILRQKRVGWLVAGVVFGVAAPIWAGGGSRTGESISVTGTFAIHPTPDKRQIPLEAIYWLDYRSAKLFATIPKVSQTLGADLLGDSVSRDLIADFKLSPESAPHFLMNASSLGAFGGGTSALIVIETSTKKLGVYQYVAQGDGMNAKADFKMIQLRPYALPTGDQTGLEATSTVGAITIQMTPDKTQVPLDAIYWVEANYQAATLYSAVPEVRKTSVMTQLIGEVASRNLATDFKLKPGTSPHFMINTASLGAPGMGTTALFVQETTTKQLGIYRSTPQTNVNGTKPMIELMQIKSYEESLPALPGVPVGN